MQKIREFFREVTMEMKKVIYPNREELIGSTWVVIITVVIVSFFLGIVDLGLAEIIKKLLGN